MVDLPSFSGVGMFPLFRLLPVLRSWVLVQGQSIHPGRCCVIRRMALLRRRRQASRLVRVGERLNGRLGDGGARPEHEQDDQVDGQGHRTRLGAEVQAVRILVHLAISR